MVLLSDHGRLQVAPWLRRREPLFMTGEQYREILLVLRSIGTNYRIKDRTSRYKLVK
jgi:hypothetical protein